MVDTRFTSGAVLVKNSFINFAGMILPLLVGAAAIPFAIKGLGEEGFGILSIAWVLLSYAVMLDLGLSRATTRFTAERLHQNRLDEIPTIMWTAVLLGLGFGLFGGLVLYFIAPVLAGSLLNIPSDYLSETIKVIRYISFGLPLLLISISFKGMLGAAQRFDLVNAVQIPINTLNFVFPALSLYLGLKLSTVMLLIVALRVLASLIYLYMCSKVYPGCLKPAIYVNKRILRQMLTFGGWVTVTSVISPVLVYIDRFFIGSILPIGMLTFYTAPLEAITRIRIIPTAIMNTLFPEFSRAGADIAPDRIKMLIRKSLKGILLFTGPLSLILFFYANDILTLWLGSKFALHSTLIFKIFSFSVLLNFLALVPFTYLQGSGRPDLPAKCHLAEFPFYFILIWYMIHKFGLTGAAYAWCLRVTVDALLLFYFTFRKLPGLFKSYLSAGFKQIILLLAVFGAGLFLTARYIADISLRMIILSVLSLIMALAVYFVILSETEREMVNSMFRKRSV